MGGRGASSGMSETKKKYGTEYHSVYQSGNIKFVIPNDGNTTAPMETMTKGRIYVTIDKKNEVKFISYYDSNNKRTKQIDVKGKKHYIDGMPVLPHTHKGYEHDEHGTYRPSTREEKMIERVKKAWLYHTRQK